MSNLFKGMTKLGRESFRFLFQVEYIYYCENRRLERIKMLTKKDARKIVVINQNGI